MPTNAALAIATGNSRIFAKSRYNRRAQGKSL
jgi:hypothetical protein